MPEKSKRPTGLEVVQDFKDLFHGYREENYVVQRLENHMDWYINETCKTMTMMLCHVDILSDEDQERFYAIIRHIHKAGRLDLKLIHDFEVFELVEHILRTDPDYKPDNGDS